MPKNKSERELSQLQENLEYGNTELKVFIAEVLAPDIKLREQAADKMLELENLVTTYGGVVILEHIQNKSVPDYDTYLGSGKLHDIIHEMQAQGANLLILGNILKPHQIYNLNEKLRPIGAKAWDRVDLILKIFERHAKSAEAKLQIELAAIKHMGPRIFGMGMELSKQGGAGGTSARGKGETNTEIMKRHLRKKEDYIRKSLEKHKKVRAEHRKGRKRKGLSTIGIVGYTNAGKSSLLNSLTKKGVLAEDKLFATLGTSVAKLHLNYDEISQKIKEERSIGEYVGLDILLNDTIGFIRDLPPNLIDAFSSTLEDSIESDLLFHVVDASDPKIAEKIEVVDTILKEIGADQKKLYIFNKCDQIDAMKMHELEIEFEELSPIFVSAYSKMGFEELKQLLLQNI